MSTYGTVVVSPRRVASSSGGAGSTGVVVATRIITSGASVPTTSADYFVGINKTVSSATGVTLPTAPVSGQTIIVKDVKGDCNLYPITITPAAGTIDGQATFVMNVPRSSFTMIYNGSEWSVN